MLKRDFNLELNIADGFGQTRDDPITILDSNTTDASMTKMQVLKGLGMGRGILWRSIATNHFYNNQISVEQIQIETKEITESEIITQEENYYFNVSKTNMHGKSLPEIIVFSDSLANIYLPYEIGWLHFNEVRNHEPESAGSGKSILYNALGIKATIYVYDNLRSDIPASIDSADVRKEFESAVSTLMRTHPATEKLGGISKSKSFLLQVFEVNREFSIVGLGVFRGKFIKLRITHVKDSLLIDVSNQFISAVESTLKSNIIMH